MLGMAALNSLPGSDSPGHLSAGTSCLWFLAQGHVIGLLLRVVGDFQLYAGHLGLRW